MAESAVKLTANWLGKVLVEEGKYLWGAEDRVTKLRNELLWMQRFLKKAESLENKDEIVDQWVLQIKEYVSEAEDIVDDFIIDVVYQRRQTGLVNKLKRWSCILKELWALHQVASSIDSLTQKVSELTPKLTTYGVHPVDGLRAYRIQEASPEVEGQRMSYAHLEVRKIIGLEQDTKVIVGMLKRDPKEKRRGVVAIYGMGGLGKTTLATNIYKHDEIESHFEYRAWAYISKQFLFQNVLQTVLAQLTSKPAEMFSGKKVEVLISELCVFLEKNKCLVVLDDVWETKVWDSMEAAFPRDGGKSGSKVLITTRKENVAKHADLLALQKPKRLKDDESWKLLKQTLGWVDEDKKEKKAGENKERKESGECSKEKKDGEVSESHDSNKDSTQDVEVFKLGPHMFGTNGDEVKKLGEEMVKSCNGVPLAIVVLGGILRKKETYEGWRLVSENISSYLRRGNDHGKSYMEVLMLSYTDLPYHLKPCFLQLGNFPEDYEIHAEKVYRMWVAQGLITWPYNRISSTESLEDIANEYLSHLAEVGMVQIMNKASDGRIKSVRMHDLMRDVCLQKATTENFFTMVDHRNSPDEPQSLSSSSNHARLLHMAIYLANDVKNYLPDYLTSKAHKYIRSLLFFEGQEVPDGDIQEWMKRICSDFPWLRVLDIEGLRLKGRLTRDVQEMKHLRYLSLKGTNVSDLPSSVGNLMFMQTLDLRVSFSGQPLKIPNILWKLERLRHLFLPKKRYEIKNSKFLCLHTLRCLEILKNLIIGSLKAEDLQKLRKLQKLSVKDFTTKAESIKNIVYSPAAKSGHLRSCSLCIGGGVIDDESKILSRFECLHLLRVRDKISSLGEKALPQSLIELHMESCELRKDPMLIFGRLLHLKHLSMGDNSFVGTMMTCSAESFPQLLTLNLIGLTNLEDWKLEKQSMSKLEKLIIMECGKLKKIPDALPKSVMVTCSPCISGIEERGTCNYCDTTFGFSLRQEEVFIERGNDMMKLVELLVDYGDKKVVLWGPRGIGKATLAKRLYCQDRIKGRFDSIAWIHCPHRRIPSSTRTFKETVMKHKCLVILSDLAASSKNLDVILGTPTAEGSKILIIVDKALAKEDSKLVQHNLSLLSDQEGIELFETLLGSSLSGTEGDSKANLGKQLLALCSGLPQSVMMLARLLEIKKSLTEWRSIHRKVFKMDEGPPQMNLYDLCYDDLPPYLKDCFLYLAKLPENTEIPASKLYRMWIAAGLVILKDDEKLSKKRKQDRSGEGQLLEKVAARYLYELVIRGMVQVGKRGPDRKIRTCRLHITVRDLCLQKAQNEKFMEVRVKASIPKGRKYKCWRKLPLHYCQCLGEQREETVPATTDQPETSASASNEIVHLAVYLNQSGREILDNTTSINKQLKSLLFFPEASDTIAGAYDQQCFTEICKRFNSLNVLDLEGVQMIQGTLPNAVGELRQLRYLSLKGTQVSELPPNINQLSQLQTLDLRVMHSLAIPGDSFIFHHMRHLYLPDSFSVDPSLSSKLQLSEFAPLQTLTNLHTEKVDLDCISELKYLRRISVSYIHQVSEWDDKLKSKGTAIELSIKSDILINSTMLSSSQNMKKMMIKGGIPITSPLTKDMFPRFLKEVKFKHTELLADPIPVLSQLPGLTHLVFDHDSFLMKKMTFTVGFPRLNHLTLRQLSTLEELDMAAAYHLRDITPLVMDCWRLKVTLPTYAEEGTTVYHLSRGKRFKKYALVYHPLMELLHPEDLNNLHLTVTLPDGQGTTSDAAETADEEQTIDLDSELVKRQRREPVHAGDSIAAPRTTKTMIMLKNKIAPFH
ncbi:LOW QUALITY PROTEIN: hypothetical protein V2J09_001937 [Rumex salicifolius]